MSISRRKFVKELGAGLGLSLAYGILKSQKVSAKDSPSSKAVMYDIFRYMKQYPKKPIGIIPEKWKPMYTR